MDKQLIGRRVRHARELLGLSQADVAERMGRSQSNISDWERGRLGLRLPELVELAKILEQPTSFFLDEEATNGPRRTEEELRRARQMIESALKHQLPPPGGEPVGWVPLQTIAPAGIPAETWEIDHVPVPISLLHNPDIYACGVVGNSMRGQDIRDGDRVIVDTRLSAKEGNIVLARSQDGEKVIRIYRSDENGPYLAAAARGYPRLRLSKDATILGTVIGWFRYHHNG